MVLRTKLLKSGKSIKHLPQLIINTYFRIKYVQLLFSKISAPENTFTVSPAQQMNISFLGSKNEALTFNYLDCILQKL